MTQQSQKEYSATALPASEDTVSGGTHHPLLDVHPHLTAVQLALRKNDTDVATAELDHIESLLKQIDLHPSSPLRLSMLMLKGEWHRLSGAVCEMQFRLEEALAHYESAMSFFTASGAEDRNASVMIGRANVFGKRGDYPESMKEYLNAERRYSESGDKEGKINALMGIGIIHSRLGNDPQALTYYYQALELCSEESECLQKAKIVTNIGAIHLSRKEYNQADACFETALHLYAKHNDEPRLAVAYSNTCLIAYYLGQTEKAIDNAHRAIAFAEKSAHHEARITAYTTLGELANASGNAQDASRYFQDALDLAQSIGNFTKVIALLPLMADVYLTIGSADKAEACLKEALSLATELNEKKAVVSITLKLSQLFESQSRGMEAFEMFKAHHAAQTEVFHIDREKAVLQLQMHYEVNEAKRLAEAERKQSAQLKDALDKAEEANRIKSDILNVVAHDFQTPISSLLQFTFLLKELRDLPENALNWLNAIDTVSQGMLQKTIDLLTAARKEHERKWVLSPICLTTVIEQIIDASPARKKEQTITLHRLSSAEMSGEPQAIREIFENVIGNAIKYTPRKGDIIITISEHLHSLQEGVAPHPHLLVAIKDSGPGLSESDRVQLFGKFKRLTPTPTDGEASTGLGLYIAQDLVHRHCGRIWAESEGKGTGCTFFISLPKRTLHRQK